MHLVYSNNCQITACTINNIMWSITSPVIYSYHFLVHSDRHTFQVDPLTHRILNTMQGGSARPHWLAPASIRIWPNLVKTEASKPNQCYMYIPYSRYTCSVHTEATQYRASESATFCQRPLLVTGQLVYSIHHTYTIPYTVDSYSTT